MFNSEIYKAIVAISVETKPNPKFGTGFVIDQDENYTYILTARHTLLNSVSDTIKILCDYNNIKITYRKDNEDNGKKNDQIKVLEIIESESFDLAVIKLDSVWGCKPLNLNLFSGYDDREIQSGNSFYVTGYYEKEKKKNALFSREIEGEFLGYEEFTPIVGEKGGIHIKFHELTTEKASEKRGTRSKFFPGHSGSPVFYKDKTTVIGVLLEVKNKQNSGELHDQDFRVISIDALNKFWNRLSRYESTKPPTNFLKLRNLLAQGKWKEANEETIDLMLTIADRNEQKFLDENAINNFPAEDLQMIDSLWRKYSNDRFGISIQSEIYFKQPHPTMMGYKKAHYVDGKWDGLCNEVGWRENKSLIQYDELAFDLDKKGHLPYFLRRFYQNEKGTGEEVINGTYSIDKNGFTINAKTWHDSINYNVDIYWIAYGR